MLVKQGQRGEYLLTRAPQRGNGGLTSSCLRSATNPGALADVDSHSCRRAGARHARRASLCSVALRCRTFCLGFSAVRSAADVHKNGVAVARGRGPRGGGGHGGFSGRLGGRVLLCPLY